jgi:Kef-type K+ transport system membrane component KefB
MGVVSDALGLSSTTGAFAAGVLLAESGYRAQIEVGHSGRFSVKTSHLR